MRIAFRSAVLFVLSGAVCLISAQSAQPSYSITISAPQEAVVAGSEVRLDITLANTSGHDIGVFRPHGGPELHYAIDVSDRSGTPAVKTHYMRRIKSEDDSPTVGNSGPVIVIKPGEKLEEEVILSKLFDMGKPGKYTVQVHKTDDESKKVVASNTVTLTINP